MVYVGVDLHRKVSHVSVLDQQGQQLLSRRIASSPDQFLRLFGELAPEPLEVAFEATYGWGWFADLLADAGIPAHMAHPLATKAISSARVKNDAVDAKTLAHLLRGALLPEAWIAPPEVRDLRLLIRTRCSMQRIITRLKCQVHAILAEQGCHPPRAELFGPAGRRWLGELPLRPAPAAVIARLVRLIDDCAREVQAAEQELRGLLASDPRLRRLTAIPGIGFLTAAIVLAEVGDVSRFPSADHLCSWAGLTPRERSSADRIRTGHISKQGSKWLRWVLTEAAASHRARGEQRRLFDRVAAKHGNKTGRIALARRLLQLCYYALRDERGCRAYPVAIKAPRSAQARSCDVMASIRRP